MNINDEFACVYSRVATVKSLKINEFRISLTDYYFEREAHKRRS